MLVQGFIDTVGAVLTGATSTAAITIFGGGVVREMREIALQNPTYFGSVKKSTQAIRAGGFSYSPSDKSIVLGTSNTTPTSSDYDITDAEFCSSGTVDVSTNRVIVTGTYTNETTESKTFKEIGLIGATQYTNSPDGYYGILYSRSVFPEPVVILAGESKSFTITIDFNKFADTVVTA